MSRSVSTVCRDEAVCGGAASTGGQSTPPQVAARLELLEPADCQSTTISGSRACGLAEGAGLVGRYGFVMFTVEDRDRLRAALVEAARADARITAAAVTGSGALDATDEWSDIDLAFGVATGVDPGAVRVDWTDLMYREHHAVDDLTLTFGTTVFGVFLLADTLQVDLAFAPETEFGAVAPTFRLLFGTAAERTPQAEPSADRLIGMGWLYALHARSSIARGRWWQAEYMISGLRDHVLALACVRHNVPATDGRGMDSLPPDVSAAVAGALVRSLGGPELARAFGAAIAALVAEIKHVDPSRVDRLATSLQALVVPG